MAKLTQPESVGNDATRTADSAVGSVVGTVGYMSPEQIRGKPADARSDIFSFGAVLYEMLTGERAFKGDTAADTITAILTRDAPEVTRNDCEVPPALGRIVQHCLEKQRDERFQSARDVAFDLELLSGISQSAVKAIALQELPSRKRLAIPVLLLVIIVVASVIGYSIGRRRGSPSAAFQRVTFRHGSLRGARFAPDGQSFIYSAEWEGAPAELFTGQIGSSESRSLHLNAQVLAISKQGEMVVLLHPHTLGTFLVSGTLARIPLATESAPRELLEGVVSADWNPQGTDLVVITGTWGGTRGSRHTQLQYPIGKTLVEPSGWASDVRFSPQGDQIAFLEHEATGTPGRVAVTDLAGHTKHLTVNHEFLRGLAWSPDGKELWFTGSETGTAQAIYAVTLAGKERLLFRGPVRTSRYTTCHVTVTCW